MRLLLELGTSVPVFILHPTFVCFSFFTVQYIRVWIIIKNNTRFRHIQYFTFCVVDTVRYYFCNTRTLYLLQLCLQPIMMYWMFFYCTTVLLNTVCVCASLIHNLETMFTVTLFDWSWIGTTLYFDLSVHYRKNHNACRTYDIAKYNNISVSCINRFSLRLFPLGYHVDIDRSSWLCPNVAQNEAASGQVIMNRLAAVRLLRRLAPRSASGRSFVFQVNVPFHRLPDANSSKDFESVTFIDVGWFFKELSFSEF